MTATDIPVFALKTTADLLAFLPALTALPVEDSLIVAPFRGTQTSRALRIRTEAEPTAASSRMLVSSVVGSLTRLEHCDSVAVAVYRSEPFAQCAHHWHDILDVLLERLHAAGFHVKDAAIVAADGWMPYFDGDLESPRPLSEIEAAQQSVPEEVLADRDLHVLPASDPELTRVVTGLVLDRVDFAGEADAFGRLTHTAPPNPIDVLEGALSGDPTTAKALTLARLIAQIDSEGAVDRTVLQIAFGREIATQSWSSTLMTRVEAADAGVTPVELMLQRDDSRSERALADLLTGQTRAVPSQERLYAAARLLGRAIVHCTLPERAWIMCALAWVRWALGMTSAAFDLLDTAARVDPRNSAVPVLRTVFHHLTPTWVFLSESPNRHERRRRASAGRA